jgi:histidine triad (HIT) family protein
MCLFCQIAAGTIPVTRLYEDEHALAFADIHPQAPVHILVIPKKHIASLADTSAADAPLLGHLLTAVAEIAKQQGLAQGFRTVLNTGADGGQTVEHLHAHLLGGRPMGWPPG